VYTILPCGPRAVNNYPNIVSPLPVVDHYGVRARAVSPFPTFFPSHLRPPAPIRRLLTLVYLSVEVSGEGGTFTMPVWAQSIMRAAEFVASRFPGREVRVIFPIDGEGFFLDEGGVEELGTSPPLVD
jgi:hypothetical protein